MYALAPLCNNLIPIVGHALVTYFSVVKLWFTCSALASAVAPRSLISLNPRLLKEYFIINTAQ